MAGHLAWLAVLFGFVVLRFSYADILSNLHVFLQESLQTSRLAREVDLKDLWRIVHVDVDKECFDSQVGRLAREVDLKYLWRIVHVDVEKECFDSQVGRLAREVDLKDLWRIVHVDVEKECFDS